MMKQGFTYDDVLLAPQYSEVSPQDVDTSVQLTKRIQLDIPILSAPMDTVTEDKMAIGLGKLGGLGVIHRSNTVNEQVLLVMKIKKAKVLVGAACGPHDIERARALDKAGADIIVVDCAHAHKGSIIASAKKIKKAIKANMMMGNIATAKAAVALMKVADVIKVGVGPGAICTTRVVAGVGVPQLSALINTVKALKGRVPIIADGGLKYSGDVVKALAVGAKAVMFGSMLAGLDESPGKILTIRGGKFKVYRGMGSQAVMNKNKSADRYFQAGSKKYVPEGVEGLVPYKGRLTDAIYQIVGGLKSGMGYLGAKNLSEISEKAEFVQLTAVALKESHPHSLSEIKAAVNYR